MGALRHGSELVPQWFYIPPPYNQVDAIRIQGVPKGARRTYSVTPRETVQIIGKSKAVVPRVVTKDLGWVDLRIIDGSRIEFAGGGLKTDVGTRDPSPTRGMSLRGGDNVPEHYAGEARRVEPEPLEEPSEETILAPRQARARASSPTKRAPKAKKPLTPWEYTTTLKGFNMYTGEGT